MKFFRPTTPSRRLMTVVPFKAVLSAVLPMKSATHGFKRHVGRNSAGRITVRHKGGGHKRRYRIVDFKYDKKEIPAKIETLEYDPNRSGFISRVLFVDGERRYILASKGASIGDMISVSANAAQKPANRMPLKAIPVGSFVYNVELKEGGGAKIARSAGSHVEVLAHDDEGYTHLKMPSTEIKKVRSRCWASFGEVSNQEHKLIVVGKAGRSRWLGIRPTVRGSAMNPVDHPYGGGEGRAGRGRRRAVSLWGKPTGKGQKTRRAKKYSNFMIVSRRKVGKRG